MELIKTRRLDAISVLVLAGIVFTLVATAMGGSARLIQIRDALVTGVIGLMFLGSLLLEKPMIFYLARATQARNTEEGAKRIRDDVAAAGRQGDVPADDRRLGRRAGAADDADVLAGLDLANWAVPVAVAVHFLCHFRRDDGLELLVRQAPPGAGPATRRPASGAVAGR